MSPKKLLACLTVLAILGAGGLATLFVAVLLFMGGINISITWPWADSRLDTEALNLIQDSAVEALVAKSTGDEIMASPLASGTLIFEDDFSANRNGWGEYGPDDLGNEIAVRDGAYQIHSIFEEGLDNLLRGWTTAAFLEELDLRVEATQVAGTDNNEIAVIFGVIDNDNFYEFAYSGDGFMMLGRYVDRNWEFIQDWNSSEAIILGDATNEVRLVVRNGSLTAFINGEEVMVSEVPDYAGGFIGFGCGPFEAPETLCTFDNLEVREVGNTEARSSGSLAFGERNSVVSAFSSRIGLLAAPLPQIEVGMQEVADRILRARDELAGFTPPQQLADYYRSVLDWATQLGTTAQNIATGQIPRGEARQAWNSLPAEPAPFSLSLTDQQSAAALEWTVGKIDAAKTQVLLSLAQGDREAVRYVDAQLRAQNHFLSGVPWCNGDLLCLQTRQGLARAHQAAFSYLAKDEPWRKGWFEAMLQDEEPMPLDGLYLASVQISCIGGDAVEQDRYLSRFTSNESFEFGVSGNKLFIGYAEQPITIDASGLAQRSWSENTEFGQAQADLNVRFTTSPGSDKVLVEGEETHSFTQTEGSSSSTMRCVHSFTAQKQGLQSPTPGETPTPEGPTTETPTPTIAHPTPTPTLGVTQNFDGQYEGEGFITCPSSSGTVVAAFTLRGNQITDHETGATAYVTWNSSGGASWTWSYSLGGSDIREEHVAQFTVLSSGEAIVDGTVTVYGYDPGGSCEGNYTGHRYSL